LNGFPDREKKHAALWGEHSPVVGMVHLLPLPGAPGYGGSLEEVISRATEETAQLSDGGLDGILVENYGDTPFFPLKVPPETVAAMALVVREVSGKTSIPVGVNVLRNDAEAALAVAATTGGSFIRVNVHTGAMFTDQGLIQGQAHRTIRNRTSLAPATAILADVLVKHATPPPGLLPEAAARDVWFRGWADGLVLSGMETGAPVDLHTVQTVKSALPSEAKVWVGSGGNPDNARSLLKVADGMIVGSAFRLGGIAGAPVDPERVRVFMESLDRV